MQTSLYMLFLLENGKFYIFSSLSFHIKINLETRICMSEHRDAIFMGLEGWGFEGGDKRFCLKAAFAEQAHSYLLGCTQPLNKWKR